MTIALFIEQLMNGLQLGIMLFLMSAGLTLVFGIMNMINLMHGTFYMAGAFLAATIVKLSGSFVLGLLGGVAGAAALGAVVELGLLRKFYSRSHLDQVLVTGYIQRLLDRIEFKQTAYALDRDSRKAALALFLKRACAATRRRSKRSAAWLPRSCASLT